jgi:hypothetical protein
MFCILFGSRLEITVRKRGGILLPSVQPFQAPPRKKHDNAKDAGVQLHP